MLLQALRLGATLYGSGGQVFHLTLVQNVGYYLFGIYCLLGVHGPQLVGNNFTKAGVVIRRVLLEVLAGQGQQVLYIQSNVTFRCLNGGRGF